MPENATAHDAADCIALELSNKELALALNATTDYKFLRTPCTVSFIWKMKQGVDDVHEGYRHSLMLNDEPPVKTQHNLPA